MGRIRPHQLTAGVLEVGLATGLAMRCANGHAVEALRRGMHSPLRLVAECRPNVHEDGLHIAVRRKRAGRGRAATKPFAS
jgi:hypothetical protein